MNKNDKIQNIMRSFDETHDGSPFSLSEIHQRICLSFTILTASTMFLSLGLGISIAHTWKLKKEMAVIREAVYKIDPFVIQDAESHIEENPF